MRPLAIAMLITACSTTPEEMPPEPDTVECTITCHGLDGADYDVPYEMIAPWEVPSPPEPGQLSWYHEFHNACGQQKRAFGPDSECREYSCDCDTSGGPE